MSDPEQPVDPELLIAHTESVRALARRLVHDPGRADDLVQDTLIAAVERPPRPEVPLRPWLLSVVRRMAARLHRGESRRARREAASASPRAGPEAAAVVVRAESHRLLVDVVLELDEPYRTTLLLRYFDGLEPVEIARRQGLPAATVRTRVRRGLDQIRARLDTRHGGNRRAWIALLLPLAGRPDAPMPTPAPVGPGLVAASSAVKGALVMGMKAKLGAAAVVLVAAVWAGVQLTDAGRETVEPSSPGSRDVPVTVATPARVGRNQPDADAEKPAEVPAPDVAASDEVVLRGRVIGPDGEPREGASVRALIAAPAGSSAANLAATLAAQRVRGPLGSPAQSDADGSFSLRVPTDARVRLVAELSGLSAIQAGAIVATANTRDVTLLLQPAGALEVEVVDEAGAALAGTGLELIEPRSPGAGPPAYVAFAETDGGGRARLLVPEQGQFGLRVECAGFAPEFIAYVRGGDSVRRIVLRPGVRFHGRVLQAADRTPVSGARVVVGLGADGPARILAGRTTTDATGAFVLEHVRADVPCRVLIDAGAQGRAQSAHLLVNPNESFEVLLGATRTLTGRVVVIEASADPVGAGGARLHFWESGQMEWPIEVVTGPDGRFVLAGIGPEGGSLMLDRRDPSYLPQPPEFTAVPAAREGERELLIEVARRGALVGRVVDGTGAAVAGASLEVHHTAAAHSDMVAAAGTSAADGTFRIEGEARPGETVVVVAKAPGRGIGWSEALKVPSGGDGDVGEVRLSSDRGLRGRVLDEAGAPVPGASVTAVLDFRTAPAGVVAAGPSEAPPRTTTADDGSFVLMGLAAMQYRLEVRRRGLKGEDTGPWEAETEPADVGEVVLERGFRLVGVVLDDERRPVTDAVVRVISRKAPGYAVLQVDADGRFAIDGLAAVPHVLFVHVRGAAKTPDPRDVEPPCEVELIVSRGEGTRIRGRVVGPDGLPIAAAHVIASATPAGAPPVWRMAVSDATGRFVLNAMDPGTYRITTSKPGMHFEALEGVAAGTQDAVLRGTRGATVAGRVLDPQGRGVPGAAVRVTADTVAAGGGQGGYTTTAQDGSFRVEGLSGETFELWTEGGDHVPVSVDGVVAGTDDVVLRFVRTGRSITGALHGPRGDPVRSGMVVLRSADGGIVRQNAVSDASGRFVVRGLLDGQYTLHCSSMDQRFVGTVESVEAGTVDLRVDLDWKRD